MEFKLKKAQKSKEAENQKPHGNTQGQPWHTPAAERERTRALILREFTASQMNDTRWREVVEVMRDLHLAATIKFVDVEKMVSGGGFWASADGFWDGPFGPFPVLSIEWLDIATIRVVPAAGRRLKAAKIDCTGEVEARLTAISVPYHLVSCGQGSEGGNRQAGRCVRIIGHVRKRQGKQGGVETL